jgi:nitroimidazol reductase NimA-like FMN-containing flavoprotein (pyridoxamine 5'-phosphate oxidase superfamily)
MAFKDLSESEIDRVLADERVVRVAFEANGERYLVPLGYAWHRGMLYAMTTHGRKTRMAAVNPRVSFQVDTSARTGLFSWQSVSGEGTFELLADPGEIETVSALLAARFDDMPPWMIDEYAALMQQGRTVFVRIRPSRLAGRRSEPA